MPTPVWTYECAHQGFEVERELDKVMIPLGDGLYRTAIRSQAWSHQDGTGGSDAAYRGTNIFHWTLPLVDFGSDYTGPLDFIQARIDAGFEAFYMYDPIVEPDSSNWDGTQAAGRHLVRCFDIPNRRGMTYQNANFMTFTFREVQL